MRPATILRGAFVVAVVAAAFGSPGPLHIGGLRGAPPALADAKELVANANNPIDLDIGGDGSVVFWTEGGEPEFCSTAPSINVFLAQWFSALLEEDLSCPGSNPDVAAVDSEGNIYYNDSGAGAIVKRHPWLLPDNPPPQTLATDVASAIAVDATHVYYASELGNAIKRVPKEGGAVQTVAATSPFFEVKDIALSGGRVYWTDGQDIYRVNKDGSDLQTESTGNALAIAVESDGTYVYWIEADGKVYREHWSSSVPTLIHDPGPGFVGLDIAEVMQDVYWLDGALSGGATGRLRRLPGFATPSDPPENLHFGLNIAHALTPALSSWSRYVYWAEVDGIYRLPVSAASIPPLDLTITGIEVTQVIQDLANSVPLVRSKETIARVYTQAAGADVGGVEVRLYGSRGGLPLPGSPLGRLSTDHTAKTAPQRAIYNDTANFFLPESWINGGPIQLRATINETNTIPETNPYPGNNEYVQPATTSFQRKWPRCIEMIHIPTLPQMATIEDPGFWNIVSWMQGAYPTPEVQIRRGGRISVLPWLLPEYGDYLNVSIWYYDFWSDDPDACDDDEFYYGMVHPLHYHGGNSGLGSTISSQAWGFMFTGSNGGVTQSWYPPFGGAILAHEIGHNNGREHVDCPPGLPEGTAPYPYPRCWIGPDRTTYFGLDALDQAVITPTEAGDLMSYSGNIGKPEWPSDWTYRALYSQVPNRRPVFGSAASGDMLVITGVIDSAAQTASITSSDIVPAGLVPPEEIAKFQEQQTSGPYTLEQQTPSGGVLDELSFSAGGEGDDANPSLQSFWVIAPFNADTRHVVLKDGATELAKLTRSSAAPVVQVLAPNGGEIIAGSMTVTWTGSDANGDPLTYIVQYSPDGGATWRQVGERTTATSLVIDDLRELAGSANARVRVVASDGLNVGYDASNASFTVPNNGPEPHILRPRNRTAYSEGDQVVLVGRAMDSEEGMLAGAELQWLVDAAPSGAGPDLVVSGLAPGWHTVTLKATDAATAVAYDEVQILVQDACDPRKAGPQPEPPTLPEGCHDYSGMWHEDSVASIGGMTAPTIAFNQGCTGVGVVGCNYNTGAAVTGSAAHSNFGPLYGALLTFLTARQTENLCGQYDRTSVLYSTDYGVTFAGLGLTGGSIEPGGQYFGAATGEVCGDSLTPQRVIVPLPSGTTNVAFAFDSVDSVFNDFAGQFIDAPSIICLADPDNDGVCGPVDTCPDFPDEGQLDNDKTGGPFGGTQAWISDGVGTEGGAPGGDECDPNDDNDKCDDEEEFGLTPSRDDRNPWDFASMWVPALPASGTPGGGRDTSITISDVLGVISWVGASNNHGPNVSGRDYDSDVNANGVEDGAEYDRSPTAAIGVSGPPSGAVTISDALVVLAQVGDVC